MKAARICMAFLLFTAIIFRSLPDSVFDYFHTHTHLNRLDTTPEEGCHVKEYTHNCHMAEWNYVATSAAHSIHLTFHVTGVSENPPVPVSEYFSSCPRSCGRAPPVA